MEKSKVRPRDIYINAKGVRIPKEVYLAVLAKGDGVIPVLRSYEEPEYFVTVTELFGCEWTASNPLLSRDTHPGFTGVAIDYITGKPGQSSGRDLESFHQNRKSTICLIPLIRRWSSTPSRSSKDIPSLR